MTYKEANNISIKDYLNSLGIQPVTEKGSYGMYRSPLREDNTPSFKVDYNVNPFMQRYNHSIPIFCQILGARFKVPASKSMVAPRTSWESGFLWLPNRRGVILSLLSL